MSQALESSCWGKQAHQGRKAAAAEAARLRKAGRGEVRAYHCVRGCGGWHVGHVAGWSVTSYHQQHQLAVA